MFDFRVVQRPDGRWDVCVAREGETETVIAVGFKLGADAAAWLSEHITQWEGK